MLTPQQKRLIEFYIDEMDSWGEGKLELCWYKGELQPVDFKQKLPPKGEIPKEGSINKLSTCQKPNMVYNGK